MISSGYIALISPFGNDHALDKAGMRHPSGGHEILTFKFYCDLYSQLGRWLHEPPRLGKRELDPTQFAGSLYEKIQKIDASLWSHIVPSNEFSILVHYGKRDTQEVSVLFNDLRPALRSEGKFGAS